MRHILSFSADPLLRLTSQKTGIYVPNFLWREKCHYFKYFKCFNEAEKIMAKSRNILKFITILQFSQMHLIFEISISKE